MVKAILETGMSSVGFLILIGTILSLLYYLKIIRILYSNAQENYEVEAKDRRLTIVNTILASSCLILGLFPTGVLNLIEKTVILLGGGQY